MQVKTIEQVHFEAHLGKIVRPVFTCFWDDIHRLLPSTLVTSICVKKLVCLSSPIW